MDIPHPVNAVMGPRFHALLAGNHPRTFRDVVERDGWKCHCCGLRIPGWMEVDHLDGNHADNTPTNLGCICPWCHRVRHPAALPALISFAWAPELDPAHLSRMAALAVMMETARRQDGLQQSEEQRRAPLAGGFSARDLEVAIAQVDDAMASRHLLACQVVGTGHVEALVETAWRHPAAKPALECLRWVPLRRVIALSPAGHVTVTDRIGSALLAALEDRDEIERMATDLWDRATSGDTSP